MKTLNILASLAIALVVTVSGCGQNSKSETPKNSQKSHQSDNTLLKEYAKARHGKNAQVEIQGGFSGGSYQVIVRVQIASGQYAGGYDRFSYTATVDSSAQRVTSWELYEHN